MTFNLLTKQDIDRLDEKIRAGEYVVSHVRNGEYDCNVFGNIFTGYRIALIKAQKANPGNKLGLFRGDGTGNGTDDIYIGLANPESYEWWRWTWEVARLTLEQKDAPFVSSQ